MSENAAAGVTIIAVMLVLVPVIRAMRDEWLWQREVRRVFDQLRRQIEQTKRRT